MAGRLIVASNSTVYSAQTKPYHHIISCIMIQGDRFFRGSLSLYNFGSRDETNVPDIAKRILDIAGLRNLFVQATAKHGGCVPPNNAMIMQLDIPSNMERK